MSTSLRKSGSYKELLNRIKLTEDDNIETYLSTFERIALQEGWPRPKWESLLALFLSVNAQKAYRDLNNKQAANGRYSEGRYSATMGTAWPIGFNCSMNLRGRRPDERPAAHHQGMAHNRCSHPLHPRQSGPGLLLMVATP